MKSATLKLAALVGSSLLAATMAGPGTAASATPDAGSVSVSLRPASAAADDYRTITYSLPDDLELDTGEVVHAHLDIDTTQPTIARLQEDVDGTWTDLEVVGVTTGGFEHDFALPTQAAGEVTVRLAVDADAVFPAWTSIGRWYDVTDPPVVVVKDPSTITLTRPGATAVTVGKALTVTGTVNGTTLAARRVRLELDTRHGWMGVASATTDATGRYTVRVPTDWYYSGTLRAKVLGTDSDEAAVSTTTLPMRVRPDYTPGGHANQWNAFPGVANYRWNPCGTITYKVNLTGAPKNALAQVKQAFAKVHAATGLTFVHDGATTAIPYRTDGGRKRSGADVTLAFGSDRQVRGLSGNVIGLGGWVDGYNNAIQEGAVVLDRNAHVKPGFGKGATWGSLLLHEIGHAMNLDHTPERNEVMHPGLGDFSLGHYQAGDLTGLARMGAMGGCVGGGEATPSRLRTPTWHVAS